MSAKSNELAGQAIKNAVAFNNLVIKRYDVPRPESEAAPGMRLWMLALTLVVACIGGDDAKLTPQQTVVAAPTERTPVAPLKPDCDRMRYALESEVSSAYVAKNRYRNYKNALEMAPAVPATCRVGWWHLAVARLLDLGFDRALVGFATPEAALVAALQQPDDVDVLECVAQVAALGRDIRPPADACQRAHAVVRLLSQASATFRDRVVADRGKDSERYICARAAIAEGDGASANGALDEITDPDRTRRLRGRPRTSSQTHE